MTKVWLRTYTETNTNKFTNDLDNKYKKISTTRTKDHNAPGRESLGAESSLWIAASVRLATKLRFNSWSFNFSLLLEMIFEVIVMLKFISWQFLELSLYIIALKDLQMAPVVRGNCMCWGQRRSCWTQGQPWCHIRILICVLDLCKLWY